MRSLSYAVVAFGLCLSNAACSPSTAPAPAPAPAVVQQPALDTDEHKALYALGQVVGGNIQESFGLSEAELALVQAGIADAVLGRDSRVDLDVYEAGVNALARDRATKRTAAEKQAAAELITRLAQEPGAERNASGSVYIPITAGTGASPMATDTVRVHYHGTLRDGSVFDSSVQRNEPAEFPLNRVIPCWTENVQKMKVGGKARLVCPSDTAYGDGGTEGIPGGAALVFEVELLGIGAE